MALDIRHLHFLVAVADAGSLSAAARRLGLRQPTVTTQLQRIESALGGALFERSASGVRPTALGEATLQRARLVLAQVDTVADLVREPVSDVRVRTFALPFELLLPLLARLAPTVRWEVATGGTAEGMAAVAAEQADLHFGLWWPEQGAPPDLVVEELVHANGWVMLPAGHPRAGDAVVPLRALAGEPFVSPPEPELQQAVLEDCRRAGFEPNVRVRPGDLRGVLAAVESGKAVAITPAVADVTPAVVLRPCSGTRRNSWALVHRRTLPADLLRMLSELVRWAYATRARSNPELFASLPPDLAAAPFPAPYEPEGPDR